MLDKSEYVFTKPSYALFQFWKCCEGRERRQYSVDKFFYQICLQIKVKLMRQKNVCGAKNFNMAVFRIRNETDFFRSSKNLYFSGNFGSVSAIVAGFPYLKRWFSHNLSMRCQNNFSSMISSSVETFFCGNFPLCLKMKKKK